MLCLVKVQVTSICGNLINSSEMQMKANCISHLINFLFIDKTAMDVADLPGFLVHPTDSRLIS